MIQCSDVVGDEKYHMPSPLVLLLSTEGLIIPYHVMYMHKDARQLTTPAQPIPATGIRKPGQFF